MAPVLLDTGEVSTLDTVLKLVLPSATFDMVLNKRLTILIHGLDVRLDVPLQWLSENLSYPDNFLHIALVASKTSQD